MHLYIKFIQQKNECHIKYHNGGLTMPNCEFVTFISILACNIAREKTVEELNILSTFFVQLR